MTGETVPMFEPTPTEERAGETDTGERCDDPTPRLYIRRLTDYSELHECTT